MSNEKTPVAYLHQVVCGDGEPDQALSFAPDNFPLAGALGYRSLSYVPLYTAPRVDVDAISENEQLRRDLEIALDMLAQWCVAVDVNGTGWDDWDEYYKDAAYRPGPLREQLDAAIAEVRKQRQ